MNNNHLLLFGLYVTHLTLFSNEKDLKKKFPLAKKPEFMNLES